MAKFIVDFNNKNYDIDEASLSAATNALKSHLSTVMSGSGATINFGGVAYGIDSTKLTAATNDFVSHLGKISGSGSKVTVGGVQYGVDSTKLSGAISDLEAVLGNLHSEGDGNDYTEVIIPSTTVPFQEQAGTGIYAFETPSNVIFNEGEKYLVVFDGESYEVTIKSFTYTFDEGTTKISYAGNGDIIRSFFAGGQGTVAGLESSSEPFALMQHEIMGVLTTSTDATHTIEILGCSQSEEGGSGEQIAAGLYQTGSNYSTLIKDWDTLLADGVVHVDNGVVSTNLDMNTWVNPSSSVLVGDLVLPSDGSITSFAGFAFAYCAGLTSVEISDSVKTIGHDAFADCTGLTEIKIPNSVTYIGDTAFYNCTNLTKVELSNSITHIGNWPFRYCNNLTSIYYDGTVEEFRQFILNNGVSWKDGSGISEAICNDGVSEVKY